MVGTGGRIGVVTDSTADLPIALADALDLRVVPMSVTFGTESFISRVTISDDEFYERLAASDVLPTTAQPNPAWFEEAYADCADEGLDAVVSIHVSRELSGTVSAAERAAQDADIPVHVVDSRQVGGGLALLAVAAHRAARGGASLDDVLEVVERVRRSLVTAVVVDELENLRKGGRASGMQAFVGNVLRVKPILEVRDGRIEAVERTRTMPRALDRIVERVASGLDGRAADVIVTHAVAPERAAEVLDRLQAAVDVRVALTTVFGPVLGTHTGPGAVAIAACPSDAASRDELLADLPVPDDLWEGGTAGSIG